MKILLTGASGFLGKSIVTELNKFHIDTIGRAKGDKIKFDLTSSQIPLIVDQYDVVIHVAGKAHCIPKTKDAIHEFFNVNVKGTSNFLKGLENCNLLKSFVFISSVAVYGLETGTMISEDYPLLAKDPYGKSKIEAEQLVYDWCKANGIICTILRSPLIAGPNPPGNLRVMIDGIKRGYYFNIAGGKAKKSIVLAKEIAKIIPVAANIGGIYNLTDGYHPNFLELSQLVAKQLGKSNPLNIPMWMAKLMAKVGDLIGSKAPINSDKLIKITSDLTFDDSKATQVLGWKPTPVLIGFKIN
jgi:nucleoside-diphosphate-sugar epimerase